MSRLYESCRRTISRWAQRRYSLRSKCAFAASYRSLTASAGACAVGSLAFTLSPSTCKEAETGSRLLDYACQGESNSVCAHLVQSDNMLCRPARAMEQASVPQIAHSAAQVAQLLHFHYASRVE